LRLLGGHVRRSPDDLMLVCGQWLRHCGLILVRRRQLGELRDAEVEDSRPRLRHHDVARLQIAMDDAAACAARAHRRLDAVAQNLGDTQSLPWYQSIERPSRDVFHRDEIDSASASMSWIVTTFG
jgi:hypothetical protein